MKQLTIAQGSQAWLDNRRTARGASEAPVVMSASKYMKRAELIKQKATGIVPEVDSFKQAIFNKGHETEAKARLILEEIIGEDLYPVVATDDEGYLTASFDGITMDGDVCYEHKLFNQELANQVITEDLDPHYYWQLEQQLYVSGAKKVIFVTSDGTPDNFESMEYVAVPGRIEKLIAAWKQFDIDVANYQPEEKEDPVIATVVKDLPSVMVQVSGSVAIIDNFQLFEQALRDFIKNRLIRKPKTDQDFADLTVQIKSLKKAEDALDSAEEQMIAQVQSVSDMKRTKDMLHKMARDNRLVAEKLLKEEKDNRKRELLAKASADLSGYAKLMFDRAGVPIPCSADFAGSIKGLSSIESMEEKLGAALRNAQHEANLLADLVEANRKTVEDMSLVPDFHLVCMKPKDDFAALLSVRINQRKEAEEKRLNEEREKIRAEEQAKAQQEIKAAVEQIAVIVTPEQVCVSESAKSDTQAALSITDDMQSTAKPRPDDKTGPRVTSLRIQISGELEKMNVYQLADVLAYCQVLPTRNKIAA
jgi:putative phage-type endonuclease